jgi:hypothetical protein
VGDSIEHSISGSGESIRLAAFSDCRSSDLTESWAGISGALKRVGAAGLLLGLITACGPQTLDVSPSELNERWVTDAPGYEGRYFEIRFDSLEWGMGETQLARHAIEEIEVVPQGGGRPPAYRFRYVGSEGDADVLVVHLASPNPRRIRLGSRTEVWTPEE